MGLPAGFQDGYNLRIQSAVWNEQGIRAVGDAMPYPGMGLLVAWDVRTGKPLWKLGEIYNGLTNRPRPARAVAWTRDGLRLASVSGSGIDDVQIDVWEAETGRKTQTLKGDRIGHRDAVALAWSPDGRSLACVAEKTQVWKPADSPVPRTLQRAGKPSSEADQVFLAWAADSQSLAVLECRTTSDHQAELTAWDMATGRERFTWKRPYELSYLHTPIAWSPDGKRLAWGGPTPAVWTVATASEDFPLAGHGAAVGDVAWNADGTRVVSRSEVFGGFSRGFELKVWDATTRQEVLMLRGPMAGWLVAPGLPWPGNPPGPRIRSGRRGRLGSPAPR